AQASLRVGAADDPLEREADRVADAVVSGAAARPARGSAAGAGFPVQRQPQGPEPDHGPEPGTGEDPGYEVDEDITEDDIVGDEGGLPKLQDGAAPVSRGLRLPPGAGRPLDAATRTLVETRMGHDFGRVRVHTDRDAGAAAEGIRAHAFTAGSHVYFNHGRYAPGTTPGLRLLAHELAHVVQQDGGAPAAVRRAPEPKSKAKPAKPKKKGKPCTGDCSPSLADKVTRDKCGNSKAANASRWIKHLLVRRAGHQVVATWSDASTSTWACSPSTKSGKDGKIATPVGKTTVAHKCGKCHTNYSRAGMGYFTAFMSKTTVGFHNSQKVGGGYESHGCVRVSCGVAKIINENTSSGKTGIEVVK
ncbi:MAG TPA: DUF4157 domain-containing protein, partial [Longimicrobium sp.]|nr:DUF4157 domain-containing protein [Longimicrobium sp.]